MASVVLNGSVSGSCTITAPSAAGTTTLTLPTTTDTLVGKTTTDTLTNKTLTSPTITGASITVASTAAPTFSAYQSSAQTLTSATFTKITFTTELWDTNSNFASSRFTPTVAGYYQINSGLYTTTNQNVFVAVIYKNGTAYKQQVQGGASALNGVGVSGIVYCNGSTDYIEIYGYMSTGSALLASDVHTWFDGSMIRSA